MHTCRAALVEELHAPLAVVDDLEVATPGPGEVLVRLGASGVCRSDLHSKGDLGDIVAVPSMLGHEGAGTVEQVGAGVGGVKVGDRVVLSWVAPCGGCGMCAQELPALCQDQGLFLEGLMADGTSRFSHQGRSVRHYCSSTFSELTVVPAACAVPVATDLPWEALALVGCAVTTGVGAVLNSARVQPGQSVAVIGAGGVGLSAVQGARIAGAGRIIAVDTNPAKLELARGLGATDVVDASATDPVEAVLALTGGVDHAFEALGHVATIEQAIAMTRPTGRATLIGMAMPDQRPGLPALDVVVGERVVAGSWYGSFLPARDWPRIVGWLESGDLVLDDLIERITLDDVNRAFDRIRSGEAARQVIVY
ncbi:MAG: zinc-binding dehydrogenase [Gaiellales bacterium]|jgi:S-(hydroxymethyl)glutathione dehydrogenase/alcohol dehydrogenase